MAKLCAKGKAAAKRKFKVYPSAYANMYASGVCSGKITPGGKKKSRTKKAKGGFILTPKQKKASEKAANELKKIEREKMQRDVDSEMQSRRSGMKKGGIAKGCGRVMNNRRKVTKKY